MEDISTLVRTIIFIALGIGFALGLFLLIFGLIKRGVWRKKLNQINPQDEQARVAKTAALSFKVMVIIGLILIFLAAFGLLVVSLHPSPNINVTM